MIKTLWLSFAIAVLSWLAPVSNAYAVTLVGGNITTNTTWTTANSPYEVTTSVSVLNTARLTIEPGVTVRFRSGTGLLIGRLTHDLCELDCKEAGKLDVQGTVAQPVIFTPKSGIAGDWRGVGFGPATDFGIVASSLKNLVVEKAGQGLGFGGVYGTLQGGLMFVKTGSTFTVSNVKVLQTLGDGWIVRDSTLSPVTSAAVSNTGVGLRAVGATLNLTKATLSNNSLGGARLTNTSGQLTGCAVTGNGQFGLTLDPSTPALSAALLVDGNTLQSNSGYGLRFNFSSPPDLGVNRISANGSLGMMANGATVPGAFTLPKQIGDNNLDIFSASVRIEDNGVFQIDPGVTLRFAPHTGFVIGGGQSEGTLFALGEPLAPIVMTALNGTSGGWLGLRIESYAGTDSPILLEHLLVEKAGELDPATGRRANIHAGVQLGDLVTWSDVSATDGAGDGLVLLDTAVGSPPVLGGSYSNNAGMGVNAIQSDPNLQDVDIVGNGGPGIGSIETGGGTHIFIQGCTITDNGGAGIELFQMGGDVQFNTIAFNGDYGVRYVPRSVTPVMFANNLLEGNLKPGVELVTSKTGQRLGTDSVSELVFRPQAGEPFMTFDAIQGTLGEGAARFEAGLTVFFHASAGFESCHLSNGPMQIVVSGTKDAPVVFSLAPGENGAWSGLHFGPFCVGAKAPQLDYVVIAGAGLLSTADGSVAPFRAGLAFHQAQGSVRNVTISDSAGVGILAVNATPNVQNAIVAFNVDSWGRFTGPSLPTIGRVDQFSNGPFVGIVPSGATVEDFDPLFVDRLNGDYSLSVGSSAIDGGLSVGLPFLGSAPELGGVEHTP